MRTVTYYDDGTRDERITCAHAWRFRRLELCVAWYVGPLPTWFYFCAGGTMHHGSKSTTLRMFRLMLGYRWYDQPVRQTK